MTASPRALMPDYLRLVALFGIVVVNVQYVAFSALGSFADPSGDTALDAITLWLVNGLALFKTYGLFSFMFGVGLKKLGQKKPGQTHFSRSFCRFLEWPPAWFGPQVTA
jgi:uncharacterized membrane protein YeiB